MAEWYRAKTWLDREFDPGDAFFLAGYLADICCYVGSNPGFGTIKMQKRRCVFGVFLGVFLYQGCVSIYFKETHRKHTENTPTQFSNRYHLINEWCVSIGVLL